MRLEPRAEGRGVNLHDGGAGQGVGAHELVIGRVEGDGDDADFARDAFGAPGEVAGVEAQGPVFLVAAAGADEVDAFGADARVGGLAAFFEGSARWRVSGLGWKRGGGGEIGGSTVSCGSRLALHRFRNACGASLVRYP